jgi:hypothetical protein
LPDVFPLEATPGPVPALLDDEREKEDLRSVFLAAYDTRLLFLSLSGHFEVVLLHVSASI